AARALDRVALFDVGVRSHNDRTDVVLLQVEGHAVGFAGKLQQLTGHALVQAPHARDPVAHHNDGTDVLDLHVGLEALDLLFQDGTDLFGPDCHSSHPTFSSRVPRRLSLRRWSRRATLPSITRSPMRATTPPRKIGRAHV